MVTLLTSNVAGGLFTAQPPISLHVTQAQIYSVTNPLLIQTELNQPEGTPLQLVIQNVNNAATLASHLNQQFQAGQLTDTATGEPLQAWAGASTIASASGSTLTLRWRKGQAFIVPLLWGLVIVIAIIGLYLLIRNLMAAHWTLGKVPVGAASAGSEPLGIPLWEWVVGGVALLLITPYAIDEYTRYVQAHGRLVQAERRYGPL